MVAKPWLLIIVTWVGLVTTGICAVVTWEMAGTDSGGDGTFPNPPMYFPQSSGPPGLTGQQPLQGLLPRGYKLEQPPKFAGGQQDFDYFVLRFRSFLRAQYPEFDDLFRLVEQQEQAVSLGHGPDVDSSTADFRRRAIPYANLLETYLLETTTGEAHVLVMELVRNRENGFEIWRRLTLRYSTPKHMTNRTLLLESSTTGST